MENQGQPSGSSFGPRLRISTRWKATNGSMRKATNRFRSKRMNQIAKDMKKRQAYMPPNKWNRNDRKGIGVANNAHMHGGKETYVSDKKDQNGNIISALASKVPRTYSNSRPRQSLDVLPLDTTSILSINGASKSKQSLSHVLENIRQPPSSRLCNDPLVDIKLSDPSRVNDVLPSTNLENPIPFLAKDGSTARLGPQMQSHFTEMQEAHNLDIARGPHPISSKVMTKSAHTAKHTDVSNSDDDTLVLKSNHPSGRTQGQHINVRKSTDEISKPLNCNGVLEGSNISLASEHLVPNKYDSNECMTTQGKAMEVKEKQREACICEAHAMYEDSHKQEEIKKANIAPNSSLLVNFDKLTEEHVTEVEKISSNLFVKDLSRYQSHKAPCNEDKNHAIVSSKDVVQSKLKLHKKDQPARNVGKINDVISKRKMESLLAKKLETCGGDDSRRVVQWDDPTLITVKRRCIPSNEEYEDEASGYNTNLMGVGGTSGLTPHIVISTDCIERQCGYCSKPIDKPTWR